MLTLEMIQDAQAALRGIARRTPLEGAPKIGENLYIKSENLQLTGAFKLRGAYNKIRSLTPAEAERGVIDLETIRVANTALIDTLTEVQKIQREGAQKRAEASIELGRLEKELRDKVLEINKQ